MCQPTAFVRGSYGLFCFVGEAVEDGFAVGFGVGFLGVEGDVCAGEAATGLGADEAGVHLAHGSECLAIC